MDIPILRRPGQQPTEAERLDVLRGLAGKEKEQKLVLPPGYQPRKKARKRR